jgi:hypothetical protein
LPAPLYTRETTDDERRARSRDRIARSVRMHRLPPDAVADLDAIAYAYAGHEEELQALSEELEQLQGADAEQQEEAARRAELARMTDRVLEEWEADRRRKAEAEARKRLKKDERP